MNANWTIFLQKLLPNVGDFAGWLLPEWLLVGGIVLFVCLSWFKVKALDLWMGIVISTVLGGLIAQWPTEATSIFNGQYIVDQTGNWAKMLCILGMGGYLGFVRLSGRQAYHQQAELYILLLGLQLGLHFLIGAQHLVLMLVALELVSLCSYLLVAFPKNKADHSRVSLTYVLFGLFSSAITIYGVSWLYGLAGSLDMADGQFLAAIATQEPVLIWIAMGMFLAAFLFKLTAFPFHFWVADVYEGISYPLATLLSVTPKIAASLIIMRVLHALEGWEGLYGIQYLLLGLAIISISWGNLGALVQEKMKKLMAYSGVSHAGYLLLALAWVSITGEAALLFYLTLYLFMNYATFTGLNFFVSQRDEVKDMAGQGMNHPILGVILGINLVALAGLPPTAGFIAKWYVVTAAIEQLTETNQYWLLSLLGITVINTAISLFYYLKPIVWLFFRKPIEGYILRDKPLWGSFIVLLTLPVMVFGVSQFDRLLNLFTAILWK